VGLRPLLDALCQPLEILADVRISRPYLREHGVVFLPAREDEGSQRLFYEINIDEVLGDENAERLHLLGELDVHHVLSKRQRVEFLAAFRECRVDHEPEQLREIARLEVPQCLQSEALAPVALDRSHLCEAEHEADEEGEREGDIGEKRDEFGDRHRLWDLVLTV